MSGFIGLFCSTHLAAAGTTTNALFVGGTLNQAWPWTPGSGWGSKYSAPATDINGGNYVEDCDWQGQGTVCSASPFSTNYLYAYPFSAGFGTKYANAATPPTSAQAVAFSADGTFILAGLYSTTVAIVAYPWSAGFGTKYTAPATNPPGTYVDGCCSNSASTYIFTAGTTSPYVRAWAWSSGFGSAVSDPATTPDAEGRNIHYHGGDVICSYSNTSARSVRAWPFTTTWGSAYSQPATESAGLCYGAAFSPDGTLVAIASDTSPYINLYPYTVGVGFGSKYANPGTLPTGAGHNCSFSSANEIAVVMAASPYAGVYPFSSGFGSKYADPGTLPVGGGSAIKFN